MPKYLVGRVENRVPQARKILILIVRQTRFRGRSRNTEHNYFLLCTANCIPGYIEDFQQHRRVESESKLSRSHFIFVVGCVENRVPQACKILILIARQTCCCGRSRITEHNYFLRASLTAYRVILRTFNSIEGWRVSQNFQGLILFFLPVNWVDFKAYQRSYGMKISHHSPVHI